MHTWELIPGPQSMHAQTTHPRSQLKQVGSNPELSNTLLWHIPSSSIFALILVCLFIKSEKSMHCISRYTYGKWNPGFKSVNNVHFMVKIKGKSVRIWNWLVKIELFYGCLGSVSAYETETFPFETETETETLASETETRHETHKHCLETCLETETGLETPNTAMYCNFLLTKIAIILNCERLW